MTGVGRPTSRTSRVGIVGSGFGRLFAAQALKRAPVDVTLIGKTSHHLFQPLLYQVATGTLSEGEIAPATLGPAAGRAVRRGARPGRAGAGAARPHPARAPRGALVGNMMALDKLPGVAQVAIQGGRYAAEAIKRRLGGKAPQVPFRYFDKGSMATISRFSAVADIGRFRFGGFIAWVLWLFVHLMYIVGFKSRVTTVFHWLISFLGRGRSQRVATQQQVYGRLALEHLGEGFSASRIGACSRPLVSWEKSWRRHGIDLWVPSADVVSLVLSRGEQDPEDEGGRYVHGDAALHAARVVVGVSDSAEDRYFLGRAGAGAGVRCHRSPCRCVLCSVV